MLEHAAGPRLISKTLKKPRVKVAFPAVKGVRDKNVRHRINEMIFSQVDWLLKSQGYGEDPAREFSVEYRVTLNRSGILSLILQSSFYPEDGACAHPVWKTLTINLTNGNVYSLRSLFKEKSHFISRIDENIKKVIREKEIPLIIEFHTCLAGTGAGTGTGKGTGTGTGGGTGRTPEFYLTEEALVVLFQPGEYTPCSFGMLEFPIPYAEIRDLLRMPGLPATLTPTQAQVDY